jgi:hypothetical protein
MVPQEHVVRIATFGAIAMMAYKQPVNYGTELHLIDNPIGIVQFALDTKSTIAFLFA